jgi:iron complex outermembrane receptor protein
MSARGGTGTSEPEYLHANKQNLGKSKVDVLDGAGNVTGQEDVRYKVDSFATFDWQTVWTRGTKWSLTAGVLNFTDKHPPFIPSTSGAGRGQQFGYDDRYYDARGRTGYIKASYKFGSER